VSVRYRIVIDCIEAEPADEKERYDLQGRMYQLRRAAWEAVSDAGHGNYGATLEGPLKEIRPGVWVEEESNA